MFKLAIIDIGSNSLRLLMVEIDSSGCFKIIEQLRESIRLGADMSESKMMSPDRIEKAIRTLSNFRDFCNLFKIDEILAVATEAVRKAENKSFFLERSKYETGIDVRVLSGDEEAYYDALAVTKSMYVSNSLVIDIGGASTELAWIRENKVIEYLSLPFGAVNLTQKFMPEGFITNEIERRILEYIDESLSGISWIKVNVFESVIGIGGTIRNLGKIHRKKSGYPLDVQHNYEISYSDIHNICNTIKEMNPGERQSIAGLSADRADIFTAPLLAFDYIMSRLNVRNLLLSSKGLREGLLYEYVGKIEPIGDILEYSLRNLLSSNSLDSEYCFNFYRITDKFYSKFQQVHHFSSGWESIIKLSSILFISGLNIIYYDYESHCMELSYNSEIAGISHRKLVIGAFSAYYARNWNFPVPERLIYGIMDKEDIKEIKRNGIFISIVEVLRQKVEDIREVELNITETSAIIKLNLSVGEGMGADISDNCIRNFKELFGRDLIIL